MRQPSGGSFEAELFDGMQMNDSMRVSQDKMNILRNKNDFLFHSNQIRINILN